MNRIFNGVWDRFFNGVGYFLFYVDGEGLRDMDRIGLFNWDFDWNRHLLLNSVGHVFVYWNMDWIRFVHMHFDWERNMFLHRVRHLLFNVDVVGLGDVHRIGFVHMDFDSVWYLNIEK